ncbi:MAG: hypothetical protein KDA42_15835, partial [Planctomycetales bacterium]|nr:hypothetical protein [Planctomycetales bacterium]
MLQRSALLLFALLALLADSLPAADLTRVGVLGNSGESAESLATFPGETAAGIGPVLDDDRTLWERGGLGQLNRYALDGRLLASFELPAISDHNDLMTRAGEWLVLRLRGAIYVLPLAAQSGAQPELLLQNVDVLSFGSCDGRVAVYQKNENTVAWLDTATGKTTPIATPEFSVQSLFVEADGTVDVFGEGQVQAWKDARPVAGFPKEFRGERPQKFGRYWYSHGWHGTIHRLNEQFEPDPGVVLGGASGSFIGYLPQSVDVTNGRGLVHVQGNVFAVSGKNGVVQLLEWNADELRFAVVRRLGALAGLSGLAIDAAGAIWTPRGSIRWHDSCEMPFTLGDREPDILAQPVVLGGRTLCVLKKHYNY